MFFKKKNNIGLEQLKRHEGLKLQMYKCPTGYPTIGYGHRLDINPISEIAAEQILKDDLNLFIPSIIANFPIYEKLNEARRWVLINMAFNLGISGLKQFKNTLKYIENGEYEKAAINMLLSKWATQVGSRAKELAKQMQTGEFVK